MADRCRSCTSEIEDGAVVCIHCGAAAPVDARPLPGEASGSSGPAPRFSSAVPAGADAFPLPFSTTLLDADRHLEGLSGWLILVGFGLVVSPFLILGSTVVSNLPLVTNVVYKAFLDTHPAVEGLIVFEIATNFIFVAILAALNFLFFKKKRSFPTYMMLYLILNSLIVVGDAVAAHALLPTVHTPYAGVMRSVLGAMIWIPYLVVSRRVKVTFVN